MITGVASGRIVVFADLGINHIELVVGVTGANPVDAGVIGFTRAGWPLIAFEPMKGHNAGTVGMPSGLPAIHKAVAPQGSVGGAGRSDVKVPHDDGGQVGQRGELGGDDVD